jgi:hypothetical protein
LALVAVSCASPRGAVVHPPTNASPSPAVQPLVAVLDHPFGSVPNTLRLLRPDGAVVAQATLDPDAEAIAVAGSHVLIAGAGRITEVDGDGTSVPLPTLPGNPDTDLVRGLVADPSGTRWMWASVAQGDGSVDSRLYVAGDSASPAASSPALLVERRSSGAALQPVAWTAGGAVVSEEPLGIGGYVLFRRTFGAASVLDVSTRTLRPLTDAACAFSDLRADGTIACVIDGREGPHGSGPVTLRIVTPGRSSVSVALPDSVQQAGAAFFSPRGDVLSLGTSPALGEGQERIETDLVDVATGARHAFGPAGVMPVAWLPDGRLVAVRLPGVAGGDVGMYVIAPDGTATPISPASTVIGVLR